VTTVSIGDDYGALDDLIALPGEKAVDLAKVTLRKLRYWDITNLVRPSISKRVNARQTVRLYDFNDLIALFVTAQLRQRKFTLQHVRKVVEHLRSRGYAEPLAELRFATCGDQIYFRHPDGSWEGDIQPDQTVIAEVIDLGMIRSIIRAGVGRSAETAGRIERRRGRQGRRPVFAGTRIPLDAVVGRLNHGQSPAEVLEAYPDLTPEDIELASAHAASV
jgi:uncharacterized protein (DUF433 family)